MSFARMTAAAAHLLPRMYEHPFNKALFQGTLPKNTFHFYLEQDSLYLKDFAKVLKITSKRLNDKSHTEVFEALADKMIASEQNMQKKYLGELQEARFFSRPRQVEKIPVLVDYTEHLLQAAHLHSVEEAVASLVPCFWLYNKLGQMAKTSADNPYNRWITSYSSDHFTASVKAITHISETLGNNIICEARKEKMTAAFIKSMEYEIQFLDSVTANNQYRFHPEL